MSDEPLAERVVAAAALIEPGQPLVTQVMAVQLLLGAAKEDPRHVPQIRDVLAAQVTRGGQDAHLVTELNRALGELPAPW